MTNNYYTLIRYLNKKHNPSGAKLAMIHAKRKGLEIINLYDEKDDPTYGMIKEKKEEYYKNILKKLYFNKHCSNNNTEYIQNNLV